MALRAAVKKGAPLAVFLLFPLHSALAEETPVQLPTQGIPGDEPPIGLPLRGTAADETRLSIDAGIGETDNVLLTPSRPESQTLALVGTDFELKRAGLRLDADLKGDFNYIDYVQNAFGKQLLGRFDGTTDWVLIPDHLRWALDDNFGEAQLDPLAAVTPTNLEHINVVSTGPDLVLRPLSGLFLKLGARYAYTSYETSPFDNQRVLGNLSVGHDLSLASSVSLNVDMQRIRFTNTVLNTDYGRRNIYGQYAVRGSRTEVTADLGISQADDGSSWTTIPFLKLQLTRTLSASSMVQLSAGQQYTDASNSFQGLQTGATGRIAIAPVIGTTANYLDRFGTLLYRFERARTAFDVSAGWTRDTYATEPIFDVDRVTAELRVSRRLTGTFTAELSGRAARERYFAQGFSDNDYLGSAALMYRPGQRVDVRLRYDHESRIALGNDTGYTDNRVMLTVGYRILQ